MYLRKQALTLKKGNVKKKKKTQLFKNLIDLSIDIGQNTTQ